MRKLEGVVKEIVEELSYLQKREMRMRDTNGGCPRSAQKLMVESTNQRVKNFAILMLVTIVGLGAWQVGGR